MKRFFPDSSFAFVPTDWLHGTPVARNATPRYAGRAPWMQPIASDSRSQSETLLFWGEHTAGVPFETGIQRVVRHLRRGLVDHGVAVADVSWDRDARLIRHMAPRVGPMRDGRPPWLLVPEIPLTLLAEGLDAVQIGRAYGLRTAAIVHDLIPLKRPTDYTDDEIRLYTRYFEMFARADLVFATSHVVAADLRAHLASSRERVPDIVVCPLPAQFAETSRHRDPPSRPKDGPLRLLSVSTWQPRKNLPRLLRALRHVGEDRVVLTLVGRRNGWPDLDAEIVGLADTMPNVRLCHRVSDAALRDLYRDHHASIYPSHEEGFGLPVLESLWLGCPCLCHKGSSMAEVAPGGGTMMIDMTDESAIADVVCRIAGQPELLDGLRAEAVARPLRDWSDYAQAIASRLDLSVRKTVQDVGIPSNVARSRP